VGAVFISVGMAWVVFGASVAVESVSTENTIQQDLEILMQGTRDYGYFLVNLGLAVIVIGVGYSIFSIGREKREHNSDTSSKEKSL